MNSSCASEGQAPRAASSPRRQGMGMPAGSVCAFATVIPSQQRSTQCYRSDSSKRDGVGRPAVELHERPHLGGSMLQDGCHCCPLCRARASAARLYRGATPRAAPALHHTPTLAWGPLQHVAAGRPPQPQSQCTWPQAASRSVPRMSGGGSVSGSTAVLTIAAAGRGSLQGSGAVPSGTLYVVL